MTMALCFNCGDLKFGAFCPCEACQAGPTGNLELDIHFSDHLYSAETLRAFGEVIRAILRVCQDDEMRFSTFLLYVSENHADILTVNYDARTRALCTNILEEANPPPVQVHESESERWQRDRPSLN